jgi:CheY-like chemotaxis protein
MNPSQTRARVLLVDDSLPIRELLSEYLTTRGCVVTEAPDGQEALELLAQQRSFDILITDVRVPRVGGMEVLRAARRIDPPLPCLMMTGFASVEAAVEAYNAGAFDFIEKPFKLRRIWDSMQRAIQLQRDGVSHAFDRRLLNLHRRFDEMGSGDLTPDALREYACCLQRETRALAAIVLLESRDRAQWRLVVASPETGADLIEEKDVEGLRMLLRSNQPVTQESRAVRDSEGAAIPAVLNAFAIDVPGSGVRGATVAICEGEGEDRVRILGVYARILGNLLGRCPEAWDRSSEAP